MKTITIQVLRSQVQITFPIGSTFTFTDVEHLRKCIRMKMYSGSFQMLSGKACTFKVHPQRKAVQMELFKETA